MASKYMGVARMGEGGQCLQCSRTFTSFGSAKRHPCALRKPKQNGFLSHLRLDAQNAGILERSFKKKSLHLPERGQKYRSSMMKRESDSNPDLNCVR